MLQIIFTTLLLALASICQATEADYYWRSWNGSPPEDAFIAGADSRGVYYVAKAFLPGNGIYVGQVYNGQTAVYIPYTTSGSLVANSSTIDVLCHNGNEPIWHASSISVTPTLINGTTLVEPVVGGRTSYYSLNYVYIGKVVSTTGAAYVGSVHTDYYIYYTDASNTGYYATNYELLVVEAIPGQKKAVANNDVVYEEDKKVML